MLRGEEIVTKHLDKLVVGLSKRHLASIYVSLGLLATFVLVACVGAVILTPTELFNITIYALGIVDVCECDAVHAKIWLSLRLPRLLLAVLVGSVLAAGGSVTQSLFRNPLADPSLIGVSSGGAVAAVAIIVSGLPVTYVLGVSLLPVAAFCGSFLTLLLTYRLARHMGRADMHSLLLAGIAFNALATAMIGFFTLISSQQELRGFMFWLLGGFGNVDWTQLISASAFIVPSLVVIASSVKVLDAMTLGERDALWLGFSVERWKFLLLLVVALGVGASVAVAGIIGFVGLIVPHMLRLITGAGHASLIPLSMLLGAVLVLLADLVSRVVILPAELPIGILTALLGVPLFLFLLSKRRLSSL